MKTSHKRFLTTFFLLLVNLPIFAHSGSTDRWLQARTSLLACTSTVIPVMLLMGLFLLSVTRKNSMNCRVYWLSAALAKNEIIATIVFWILLSFFLTPFYSFLSALSYDVILILIMMATWVLCFLKRVRRVCANASMNHFLLNMAVSQAIGYCVYGVVVQHDSFRQLFKYTDEEYRMFNFYLYPETGGITTCLNNISDVLLVFAFPMIVCLIYAIINVIKSRKQ